MTQAPYSLDQHSRTAVLQSLREVAMHRGWTLLAAHVRTNHVHTIVEADVPPEKIMSDFKSYASRESNRRGRDGAGRKRWAQHGSTRWHWNYQEVQDAPLYIVEEQGEPMALFVAEEGVR